MVKAGSEIETAAALAEMIRERILQLEQQIEQCEQRAEKARVAVEFSGYEIARAQQQAAAASLIRCRRRLREVNNYILELEIEQEKGGKHAGV